MTLRRECIALLLTLILKVKVNIEGLVAELKKKMPSVLLRFRKAQKPLSKKKLNNIVYLLKWHLGFGRRTLKSGDGYR